MLSVQCSAVQCTAQGGRELNDQFCRVVLYRPVWGQLVDTTGQVVVTARQVVVTARLVVVIARLVVVTM